MGFLSSAGVEAEDEVLWEGRGACDELAGVRRQRLAALSSLTSPSQEDPVRQGGCSSGEVVCVEGEGQLRSPGVRESMGVSPQSDVQEDRRGCGRCSGGLDGAGAGDAWRDGWLRLTPGDQNREIRMLQTARGSAVVDFDSR